MGLLQYAITREKEKEQGVNKQIWKNYPYSPVKKQSDGNYFVTMEPETLATIRFANHMESAYFYTLDGVILNEEYQDLQKKLELHFYHTIRYYLKYGKLSKEERETLIDFQYGLLATSISVEQNHFMDECPLPLTNIGMNQEELQMSSIYFYQKVKELLNYFLDLTDNKITNETLPMILYVKSCLPMLPPLIVGSILAELKNTLGLNKLYGHATGNSRDKMCSMLSYLVETGLQKTKK